MSLEYRPLRADEIRLLTMSRRGATILDDAGPGFEDVSLTFTIVSVTAVSLPFFTALSYVWGDPADTVRLQYSGGSLCVTRNLDAILGCLASSRALDQEPTHLWIDAICVDQTQPEERAAQVPHMRLIYSRARSVLAFLSTTSAPFELGLSFLRQAARHPTRHYEPSLEPHITVQSGLDARSGALRDSIIAIFAMPWWTRVWTVQEFVLADHVTFRLGQVEISGETILAAFVSLRDHESGCCWAARREAQGDSGGYINMPSAQNGGMSLFQATRRLDQLQVMCHAEEYDVRSLLGALAMFRTRDCTDPRDHIFGMLGLDLGDKDEALRARVRVDYAVPTAQLFQDVASAMIRTSGNLDVLSHVCQYPSIRGRLQGLPSWAPDWTAMVDETFNYWYSERITRLVLYNASGSLEPVWNPIGSGRIATKALVIGQILVTAPGYPASGSSAAGQKLVKTWREIFDGRRDGGMREEGANSSDFEFACMISGGMTQRDWHQEANRHEEAFQAWCAWFTDEDGQNLQDSKRQDVRMFDSHVRWTVLERRMFRTGNGQVGLGPESAESGDVVALMPGGRVPYVLRSVRGSKEGLGGEEKTFRLLGDATVHRAMSGEMAVALDGNDRVGGGWEEISLI